MWLNIVHMELRCIFKAIINRRVTSVYSTACISINITLFHKQCFVHNLILFIKFTFIVFYCHILTKTIYEFIQLKVVTRIYCLASLYMENMPRLVAVELTCRTLCYFASAQSNHIVIYHGKCGTLEQYGKKGEQTGVKSQSELAPCNHPLNRHISTFGFNLLSFGVKIDRFVWLTIK